MVLRAMTANAPPGTGPNDEGASSVVIKDRRKRDLFKAGALQTAILNSDGFLSIATDEKGVIQIFNAGARRMLGYTAAEVVNKLKPADFSDPAQVVERARALSLEFATAITPGFEALVFKASHGIEDQYEVTYIRKDGGRLPATVSVTALRDPESEIIGYLLSGIARSSADITPPPEVDAAPKEPETASGLARRRLLYIEGEPASVGLVEQLIARRTDVLLMRAADLSLGIELARTARPDVILMNIDLPGTGAIQIVKFLRGDPATQNTPILALSANAAPGAITKGLEAGFFHYLIKPMKAEPFMEALGDALEFVALERAEQNDLPLRKEHIH
jgi:CheY-like chemotaxis protein